ncbi:unnamed protein product [Urochloa humidicola]
MDGNGAVGELTAQEMALYNRLDPHLGRQCPVPRRGAPPHKLSKAHVFGIPVCDMKEPPLSSARILF